MTARPSIPERYRIVGSGPVALACALFARRQGATPSSIDLQARIATGPAGADATRRTLALSGGSRQLLARITTLPDCGVIRHIEVSMAGRPGLTRIHAADFDVPALGYVIDWRDLVDALAGSARRAGLLPDDAGATASPPLEHADVLTIHADGMPPRDQSDERVFDQAALLAEVAVTTTVTVTLPQAGSVAASGVASRVTSVSASHLRRHRSPTAHDVAFEHFGQRGPLALLPLAEPGRYSLVWCDAPARVAERMAMDRGALDDALNDALGGRLATRLGRLSVQSPPQQVPLVRRSRRALARGAELWIGNAAQSLHPVAGQGLNLGLRDAFELGRALADRNLQPQNPALDAFAAAFVRTRQPDRQGLTWLTDLMATSFGWDMVRPLQSLFLDALDALPPLRRPLAATLLYGRRH